MIFKSLLLFIVMFVCPIVDLRPCVAQEKNPAPVIARAEVDGFLETTDYHKMKQRVARWSKEMSADDRKRVVVELSSRLMNAREVQLKDYADMFVPSRLSSGRMDFPGHGECLFQDVFLENGRCAWAIEQMLSCRLPEFSVELSEKPEKLAESVRKTLLKIIDTMAMPEKAKVADVR